MDPKLRLCLLLIAMLMGCASPQRAPVIDRTTGAAPTRPAPQPSAQRGGQAPAPATTAPAPSTATQQPKPADVVVARTQPTWDPNDPRPDFHTVQRGETLFSIALAYGLSYRELAQWNALQEPYVIRVGQQLRLHAAQNTVTVIPAKPTAVDSTSIITDQTEAAGSIGEGSGAVAEPAAPAPPQITPVPPPGTQPRNGSSAAPSLKTEPKAVKLPYTEANWARYEAPAPATAESALETVATPQAPTPAAASDPRQSGSEPRLATSSEPRPVASEPRPAASPAPAAAAEPNANVALAAPSAVVEGVEWAWPTLGRLAAAFSDEAKGIRVAGDHGQSVLASAGGQVSYVGNSLRGYGKMIVIKHNKMFLSVYAHNSKVFVKEGQTVVKGQKIAEMGATDAEDVVLHFEIRRYGKPVDPLKYLPNGAAS